MQTSLPLFLACYLSSLTCIQFSNSYHSLPPILCRVPDTYTGSLLHNYQELNLQTTLQDLDTRRLLYPKQGSRRSEVSTCVALCSNTFLLGVLTHYHDSFVPLRKRGETKTLITKGKDTPIPSLSYVELSMTIAISFSFLKLWSEIRSSRTFRGFDP